MQISKLLFYLALILLTYGFSFGQSDSIDQNIIKLGPQILPQEIPSTIITKAEKKIYIFEVDTLSQEYKSIKYIDPKSIKVIQALRSKDLHGGGKEKLVLFIEFKKRYIDRLPEPLKNRLNN